MTEDFPQDVAAIGGIPIMPTLLRTICRLSGMRFAAVARVTEARWIACAIHDEIASASPRAASCRSNRRSATRSARRPRPS